jgi:hypothetical protein
MLVLPGTFQQMRSNRTDIEMLVAVYTSRLSCREAEKAPIFTPVQESSGESKVTRIPTAAIAILGTGCSSSCAPKFDEEAR